MVNKITRRSAIAASVPALCARAARSNELTHIQVQGEWCFVGSPRRALEPKRAVIIFDGNGTTVTANSSSWEKNAAASALGREILNNGYLIAQSNRTARPDNGMWGNARSQQAILSLIDHLRNHYGVQRFSAITTSAGGLTLLNLLLNRTAVFEAAVLFAPVISLESMYRCPNGVNRVTPIAEAFQFKPSSRCPGDPEADAEFRRATRDFDPLRRLAKIRAADWRGNRMPWFVLYHQHDPKVPPSENSGRFIAIMRESGAQVRVAAPEGNTHNSDDLMRDHLKDVVQFLTGRH
jgi:pimeloyl-ACP methyl ester carboxylesterase